VSYFLVNIYAAQTALWAAFSAGASWNENFIRARRGEHAFLKAAFHLRRPAAHIFIHAFSSVHTAPLVIQY